MGELHKPKAIFPIIEKAPDRQRQYEKIIYGNDHTKLPTLRMNIGWKQNISIMKP